MMYEPFGQVARIRNNLDASHCTQFALLAALETLGDHRLDESTVDHATGYMPGGTWPYSMINWLATHDYEVKHIEDTNFELFLSDPRKEFERQGLDAKTIDLFYKISDFDFEQNALREALANSKVSLIARRPVLDDITSGVQEGWMPLLSLDATTLNGKEHDEFDGHIVLVTGASATVLRLQDPGPPMHWDWDVSHDVVLAALRTPSESSGTVTLIRRVV